MSKPITRRRLYNLAYRMIYGKEIFYYSKYSPRISTSEVRALWDLGFSIQDEWPHPPEVRQVYAMRTNGLDKKNKELLEWLKELQ